MQRLALEPFNFFRTKGPAHLICGVLSLVHQAHSQHTPVTCSSHQDMSVQHVGEQTAVLMHDTANCGISSVYAASHGLHVRAGVLLGKASHSGESPGGRLLWL